METAPTPKTLHEAIIAYANPNTAFNTMVELRWNGKPICPHCGSEKHSFISTRKIWKCKDCKKQFTVKLGTILEDSALGLDKWLCAIWLIANAKNGISSYEIHRSLGITQKSAWFMKHRIRAAMQTNKFTNSQNSAEYSKPESTNSQNSAEYSKPESTNSQNSAEYSKYIHSLQVDDIFSASEIDDGRFISEFIVRIVNPTFFSASILNSYVSDIYFFNKSTGEDSLNIYKIINNNGIIRRKEKNKTK